MLTSTTHTPRPSPESLANAGWLLSLAAFVCVLLTADPAWAGPLGTAGEKIREFLDELTPILRALFTLCGFILAYAWTKGSQDARSKTERYFIGLALAFSLTEIMNFFMPATATGS